LFDYLRAVEGWTWDPNTGEYAVNFDIAKIPENLEVLFSNTNRNEDPGPSEDFSDAFSASMLRLVILPKENMNIDDGRSVVPRVSFIDDDFCKWVTEILGIESLC
jgi:hypothetical protein